MADIDLPICLRSVDGKLIAIDANCEDVELPVCMDATGTLQVYHADCDGQAPLPLNDGWFQVCRAAGGGLQITIPDDCCIGCCGEVPFTLIYDFGNGAAGSIELPYGGIFSGYCWWRKDACCALYYLLRVATDFSWWDCSIAGVAWQHCYSTHLDPIGVFDCDGVNSYATAAWVIVQDVSDFSCSGLGNETLNVSISVEKA